MQHPACRMREVSQSPSDLVERYLHPLEFLAVVDAERQSEPFRKDDRIAEMGLYHLLRVLLLDIPDFLHEALEARVGLHPQERPPVPRDYPLQEVIVCDAVYRILVITLPHVFFHRINPSPNPRILSSSCLCGVRSASRRYDRPSLLAECLLRPWSAFRHGAASLRGGGCKRIGGHLWAPAIACAGPSS